LNDTIEWNREGLYSVQTVTAIIII